MRTGVWKSWLGMLISSPEHVCTQQACLRGYELLKRLPVGMILPDEAGLLFCCRILSTPGLRNKLDKLMAAKGASFEREAAYRASQACGELKHCRFELII